MFSLTREQARLLSREFEISDDAVKKVAEEYAKFSGDIKNQYLAHLTRSLEQAIRKKRPLFQILFYPLTNGMATASVSMLDDICCIVYFPSDIDEKQQRICIAHELGHIWIDFLGKGKLESNGKIEPLASLFAVLAVFDKSEFYKNESQEYEYRTIEEIIACCRLMSNRQHGKFNIS